MTTTQTRGVSGIVRRVTSRVTGMVEELNYSQQRATELFLGLDERRR